MRLGIIIGLWMVFTTHLKAQQQVDSSLVLQEVAVHGNFEKQFLPGNNIIVPTKNTLQHFQSENITAILNQNSSIYFKQYGNGMLTTIAMRGTNASQTAVLWNNFNINSFTLGSTDFSILPAAAINSISIVPGSGSSMGGNGAFGGAVLLESAISEDHTNQIKLAQSVGSFGTFNSDVTLDFTTGKLKGSSKVYYNQAKNNFTILQNDKTQQNAAFSQKGYTQNLSFDWNQYNTISGDFWWHKNFREIQPPIGSSVNVNYQNDENIRSQISYENTRKGILKVGSGFFQDRMIYTLGGSVSDYLVKRIESYGTYRLSLGESHQLKFSVRQNHIVAENESYQNGLATEDRYNASILLKGKFLEGFEYATHLKQQFVSDRKIPINPYLGITKRFLENRAVTILLKANSSYNFRLPTLNDRFWKDDGVPNLNAETAWNKELGVELSYYPEGVGVQMKHTYFHNQVDNWIQWIPNKVGQFQPRNIKEVIAKGLESNLTVHANFSEDLKLLVGWQQTVSQSTIMDSDGNTAEIGKQLVYTPMYKGTANASIEWEKWTVSYYFERTGEVFTINTNSPVYVLDPFNLHQLGIRYQLKNWTFQSRIKNIFNTTYMVYSGYAMPGRNYQLTVNYQLKFRK